MSTAWKRLASGGPLADRLVANAGTFKRTVGGTGRVVDDRVLQRILQGEMHRMNQALVARPALLGTLLTYDRPELPTQGGGMHLFDRATLERLWAALSPLARATLTVPIRFHLPHDHPGDAFVADAEAFDALIQLGLHGAIRNGRMWVSLPRALETARRWPTAVQFVRR